MQGIREFGSEDRVQPVASLINEKMTEMKQDIETTLEHHRIGCIHGYVERFRTDCNVFYCRPEEQRRFEFPDPEVRIS